MWRYFPGCPRDLENLENLEKPGKLKIDLENLKNLEKPGKLKNDLEKPGILSIEKIP